MDEARGQVAGGLRTRATRLRIGVCGAWRVVHQVSQTSHMSTLAHKTSLDLDASRTDLDRISRRSRDDLNQITPRSRRSLTGSHTSLRDLAAPRHELNWSQQARDVPSGRSRQMIELPGPGPKREMRRKSPKIFRLRRCSACGGASEGLARRYAPFLIDQATAVAGKTPILPLGRLSQYLLDPLIP